MDALKSKGQMYDQIDLGKIQKSGFDLSYNNKGTGRIGRIIPTRCLPTLPGDRIKGSSAAAVQFEPLAVPMLANMFVRQEHFYVPNRIVWEHWDKFFTGGEKLDYTTPPPSFNSISNVFAALMGQGLDFDDFKYGIVRDGLDSSLFYFVPSASTLEFFYTSYSAIRSKMVEIGNNNEVLDLLQPCFESIDGFMDYLRSLYNADKDARVPVFSYQDEPYSSIFDSSSEKDYKGFTNQLAYALSLSPDPFESAIAPAIDDFDGDLLDFGPLTEFGRRYVHFLYDFFKVFVGTSSNLDYLNYERLTLSDMYYSVYSSMFMQKVQVADVRTLGFEYRIFSNHTLNGLALRANYAIWYNYYRDQLLEQQCPEPNVGDTIGDDELFHLVLPRQRCWSKDTFTTALANTGTGNVVVPINTQGKMSTKIYSTPGADMDAVAAINADIYEIDTVTGDKIKIPTRFISGLAEANNGSSTTVNGYFSLDMLDACRRAQKWLQKALIYGNRPQDRLYTSWGVRSLDARLQLPECLATSAQMVQLSVNTNNTTITDAQGNAMAVAGDKSANAYGYDKGGDFNRFCEEHGFILSYLTIMPESSYSLSLSREHSFMDKFDYPTPEFATLGMDAVYMSELMVPPCQMIDTNDGQGDTFAYLPVEVFGYQGRYYGYKTKQDEEHGTLQTTDDMYTFARTFNPYDVDNYPKLNYMFVHCFPRLDMFVVDSTLEDYFRYDVHHSIAAERALPVCGMYL